MTQKRVKTTSWDISGGPVVMNPCFHCKGIGSIPGQGTNILHGTQCGQKVKKKKKKTQNWFKKHICSFPVDEHM